MTNEQKIIIVDKDDKQIGLGDKYTVHKKGLLHRAFSVLIMNDQEEMLIQKRAANKYHFPSLWSNACCSHPHPNSTLLESAFKRLYEETGIATDLTEMFSFTYCAYDKTSGLYEHELDHVLMGRSSYQEVNVNPHEIEEVRWIELPVLYKELANDAESFTPWFESIITNKVINGQTKL